MTEQAEPLKKFRLFRPFRLFRILSSIWRSANLSCMGATRLKTYCHFSDRIGRQESDR
jgi:hypothetical protein